MTIGNENSILSVGCRTILRSAVAIDATTSLASPAIAGSRGCDVVAVGGGPATTRILKARKA